MLDIILLSQCCVQDKTLAFVLPILESLVNGSAEQSKKTGRKAPCVMVLLPTRDSAVQVYAIYHHQAKFVLL